MNERSPTGGLIVPAVGPLDARIVAIAESPAQHEEEQGEPLVGRSGTITNEGLVGAGLARAQVRLVNVVPTRAPGDKFERHDPRDRAWGQALLKAELTRAITNGARVIVPMGDNPLKAIAPGLPHAPNWSDEEDAPTKEKLRVGVWRGSAFQLGNPMATIADYEKAAYGDKTRGVWVVPTYHPAAIARQYKWNPFFIGDWKKARAIAQGEWTNPPKREWFVNDVKAFARFIERMRPGTTIFFDTEQSPQYIVSVVSATEVHAFVWDEAFRPFMQRLFTSPHVMKGAQNLAHDVAFMWEALRIWTAEPTVDIGGLAKNLNTSLGKRLSPDLSTRFTSWPYHKWWVEHDPVRYCGQDSVVAYDAYGPAREQIARMGLEETAEHDRRLQYALLEMQRDGIYIDEARRAEEEAEFLAERNVRQEEFRALALPIVRERLDAFEKPHLFFKLKRCTCCGGGKTARNACWREAGFDKKPSKADLLKSPSALAHPVKMTKAELEHLLLAPCSVCAATGKIGEWLPIGPTDSQLKDILYRGLGIKAKKYKGSETSKAAALEPLAESQPLVAKYLEISAADAKYETLRRLTPGYDGMLHPVQDPYGTESGRVATYEGLIQKGTNVQNIPKKSRHVIVPKHGRLLVAPDLEQVEGRAIAVCADDDALRAIYREPVDWPGSPRHGSVDSHTQIMKRVHAHGIFLSRDQSKRVMYAGIYGGSPHQLAIELTAEAFTKGEGVKVSTEEAKIILDILFAMAPGAREWQRSVMHSLATRRQVVSPSGRIRTWGGYITKKISEPPEEGVYVKKTWETKKGKRWQILDPKIAKEGWSFPPQDIGSRVLALGLFELRKRARGLVWPKIQVHDELVCEIPESPGTLVDEALAAIRECMTIDDYLGMDFPVDVGEPAPNWRCAKGIHVGDSKCRDCGKELKNGKGR